MRSFSAWGEKDGSTKPMSTKLMIQLVVFLQSPHSRPLGRNRIGCIWVNDPPLGPITMSQGVDTVTGKAVGTEGGTVMDLSTGTT